MSQYSSSDITVKNDIDHIRQRSGMYIGESDNPHHLLKEAFDNGLDESQNGYSEKTLVSVDTENQIYSVSDLGRGIPIGEVSYNYNGFKISMEALKLLVSVAKSGGKFNESTNYKITSGLHGLGMCCITALSEWAIFTTRRDGKQVTVKSVRGVVADPIYEDTTEPNGVTVTFKGDDTIFDSIIIPQEYYYTMCNTAQAFGNKIELVVDGEIVDLPSKTLHELMPPEPDLSEYDSTEVNTTIESGESLRVALRYTSDINSKSLGFSNMLPNRSGGTHVRAVEKAIEEVWSPYFKDLEVELKPWDCRLGLRSVIAIFLEETSYSSQTKDRLTTKVKDFQPLIDKFKEDLSTYLETNPDIRQALIKRFTEYRIAQNSLLARKEIMSLIKINEPLEESGSRVRRRSVVRTLKECKSTSREGTQLYIVEGDSAAGGLARARDRITQAILPLRGKIKNIAYMSVQDALKSETVRNIINAIGCGAGPEADPRRCRYEEILVCTDADPDGAHIAALVVSVLINLVPEVVKAGLVKVVHTPLFSYELDGELHYTNEFSDIPQICIDKNKFTRYKGLGELDDEEVGELVLNRNVQVITPIEYPSDLDRFNSILGTSWGKNDLLKDLGIIKYAA